MTSSKDEFLEALHADVVIPIGPQRCLSISESLGLRDWYDERQAALRELRNDSTFGVDLPED